MTARELRGDPIASAVRAEVADRADTLRTAGTVPTLGTVLMSAAPAAKRFLDLKHEACAALGIETVDRRIPPDAPASTLTETVTSLSDDPTVDAVFVQTPLPDHVDGLEFSRRIDPAKDVDCFHPENLGLLVEGAPRFVPATTAAVCRILAWYDVPVTGRDVAVVGRSRAIGIPIANRLLWDDDPGNATVSVCHSRTADLAAKTREADVVVTACGQPALIDGEMLADGATVVDVSANRVDADTQRGYEVVGDVDFESARDVVDAITPVPGGVGPVTLAMLLENVVLAAERRA